MPAHPDAPRSSRPLRLALTLLTLAGLVQIACFGRAAWHAEQVTRQRHAWLDSSSAPGVGADIYTGLLRAFRVIEPQVPGDARMLMITDEPLIIPFDFYFLPRELRRLHAVSAKRAERWAASAPFFEGRVEQHLENLDDMGLLLTPKRLAESLSWADYVVTIYGESGLKSVREQLQPVAEHEGARLYRVQRGGP